MDRVVAGIVVDPCSVQAPEEEIVFGNIVSCIKLRGLTGAPRIEGDGFIVFPHELAVFTVAAEPDLFHTVGQSKVNDSVQFLLACNHGEVAALIPAGLLGFGPAFVFTEELIGKRQTPRQLQRTKMRQFLRRHLRRKLPRQGPV